MINVFYIISDIDKALTYEWTAGAIDKKRYKLSFILLNPGLTYLENHLKREGFDVYPIICRGKKDWPANILEIYRLLKRLRPEVIHCHMIQATIIGLVAAKLAGIKKRIYTRHHSSLHHVYFRKGLIWDKLSNALSTHIIAISGIVKTILLEWEKVPSSKVFLIPHGFLLNQFDEVEEDRILDFEKRHHVNGCVPVVGVISRFTEWKGVQYIIPAFEKLLSSYPEAVLLLLGAHGDYEQVLKEQLQKLPPGSFRLIPFEKDITAAYKVMDVFVHTPIDKHSEAFGQIYVEALAAGIPSVFTRSGIANEEYFSDEVSLIIDYKNPEAIYNGIVSILTNEKSTKQRIVAGKALSKRFEFAPFIYQLEQLYQS